MRKGTRETIRRLADPQAGREAGREGDGGRTENTKKNSTITEDQILLVKMVKYLGFYVYHRSY